MTIFVGDDWAESHHDVHLMDETGRRLAARRLPEGLEGIRRLHELVAEHAEDPGQVVVGIEVDRGLWVAALAGAGYQVYAINPLSVSRYRERHNLAGAKSDAGDAKVLADLVRTDRHNHRPIAGDSPEAEAIKVLVRGHQNLIWARTRHTNALRNALREYYPGALVAFEDLADRDAVAVLGRAPSPDVGARLSVAQLRSALRKGGRQRNLDRRAGEIQAALRAEQLGAPGVVAQAFAATTTAAVGIIGQLDRGLGQEAGGDGPPRAQPAPLRRRGPVGVLLAVDQPGMSGLLRRAPGGGRPAPPGAAGAGQPPGGHPARLSSHPHPLRRGQGLGPSPQGGGGMSVATRQATLTGLHCHHRADEQLRPHGGPDVELHSRIPAVPLDSLEPWGV